MCGASAGTSAMMLLFSIGALAVIGIAVVAGIGLARRFMGQWTILGPTATSVTLAAPDVLNNADVVDAMRASDADRQHTVTALGTHLTAGRLTPTEFDDRVKAAFGARTVGELRYLLTDLPPDPTDRG